MQKKISYKKSYQSFIVYDEDVEFPWSLVLVNFKNKNISSKTMFKTRKKAVKFWKKNIANQMKLKPYHKVVIQDKKKKWAKEIFYDFNDSKFIYKNLDKI